MKTNIDDLAVFGGKPAFEQDLCVGTPNTGDRRRFIQRVEDVLDRRWLTNDGPLVQELEKKIALLHGVKHCVAMCNGTVALEIAIRASDLRGEVIIPSYTFIATAHALQWQQIRPVFCDIDKETYTIDPVQVEKLITPKTTGIMGVHLWGRACHTEVLQEIAARHNLGLLFDAAHSFGCSHQGRMVGGFGDAEIFSFHATKIFNTLEGGAVLTNKDDLAAKMRLMRNFGFAGYDKVVYIGTNGKMNEVSAAMGLTLLESFDELVATNRENYRQYDRALRGLPGVSVVPYPDDRDKCNYQYVVVEIDEQKTGIDRDSILDILWAEHIKARRYFYPCCHRMEPYRSDPFYAGLNLPQTDGLARRVLVLPTGTAVGEQEIGEVCGIVRLAVKEAKTVAGRLARTKE